MPHKSLVSVLVTLVTSMAAIAALHAAYIMPAMLHHAGEVMDEKIDRHAITDQRQFDRVLKCLDRIEARLDHMDLKIK